MVSARLGLPQAPSLVALYHILEPSLPNVDADLGLLNHTFDRWEMSKLA